LIDDEEAEEAKQKAFEIDIAFVKLVSSVLIAFQPL
jgi:hypothetical protein